RGEPAAVADLAARLAVERRAVEDHPALFAGVEPAGELAVLQHRQHPRVLEDERLVADEAGLALLQEAEVHGIAGDGAHLAGLPRALLLALQLPLEAVAVHGEALLPGQLLGEVHGQAVRVVEAEYLGARDPP